MPPLPRSAVTWLLLLGGAYAVWAGAVFLGQRSLLYPGRGFPLPAGPGPADGVEVWMLETSVGRVEAWYHPPSARSGRLAEGDGEAAGPGGRTGAGPGVRAEGPAPAILFAHGNGERIDDWSGAFQPLADAGVAVLLVEYPGYGRSDGVPTQASITETMAAAYDRLAERPEVDGDRIVGVGRSLGGGAVAALARVRPLRGLVLQSSFTSVRAFARRYMVPSLLVRDAFDVLGVVREFDGPVLVVHGTADPVIPYSHGRALAAASPGATLVSLSCAHNDCPPDWEAWLDRLRAFVEEEEIRGGTGPGG